MRTIYADLAGTSDVLWSIQFAIPLADPQAWGNMGLQGYDEDNAGGEAPDVETAKAAVDAKAREILTKEPEVMMIHLHLIERRWEADTYEDREYGEIQTAEAIEHHEQYGGWGDDGATWDERQEMRQG